MTAGVDSGVGPGEGGAQAGGVGMPTRQDRDAAAGLAAFAAAHGGATACTAVMDHVGRVGSRIVVMGPDGRYGDLLASSQGAAERICAEAGVPVRPWDRETTNLLAPSAVDRLRMGTRRR